MAMLGKRFVLRGDKAMRAKLNKMAAQVPAKLAAALFQEGEAIMTEAKRIVPVDDSPLKNSGRTQPPEMKGKDVTVTLSFGDQAVDYALVQHERTDYRHEAGQSAKYLEKPFNKAEGGMFERVMRKVMA